MDRKTKCSFACVAAMIVLFTGQSIVAADRAISRQPAIGSTAYPSAVSPTYAVTGAYGLAAYAPPVGIPAAYVYSVPVPATGIYYYPPAVYAPIYLDAYNYHFGPGYVSPYGAGHYRFPYYSYRRPWYTPGPPVFNRNTGVVW